ncbi:MAG: hypothetical protein RLN60_00825 [Phycisphaerales bacterium]
MTETESGPVVSYTIRRKFLKLFGASFTVFDHTGAPVGYCKQKAFKLREDIRVYTDESRSDLLLAMQTHKVIDFNAAFDVTLGDGSVLASLRRKGMKSFLRDSWQVFDTEGREIAKIEEDSAALGLLRRGHEILAAMIPQTFNVIAADGRRVSSFRTHMNPFIYRLTVRIHEEDAQLDDLVLLGAACLIAAVEGRQS